ncbi:MAG: YitT family protein [Lachnospiraceae bacterium]|nr:YitT family protein [Lachnospiraceae bacterium]
MKKHMNTVFGVLVGNAILAFTVAAFIVPHGVIMGGATGIGLTIAHYVPVDLSIIIFIVNSILFVLGAAVLGKKFAVATIASTFIYPTFLSIVQKIPGIDGLTDNLMLATLYAGALLGVGIGLIVRVGSSTGGTDIVALVLNKWFHIPVAGLLYVIDFLVLGGQVFFSDTEQIMYGVLMLVLETAILNKVMLLGQSQIQLFIISEEYEHIREKMLKELDAGVTMVHIETGYGQENRKGVLCVIPNRKLYSVKELVQAIDPKAFITITQINEVRGRGFTMERVGFEEIPQDLKEAQ